MEIAESMLVLERSKIKDGIPVVSVICIAEEVVDYCSSEESCKAEDSQVWY